MNEAGEKYALETPQCPVCGTPRDDPSLDRCAGCGSDFSSLRAMEDFTTSLLFEARADIRDRRYSDAKTKLDIASWMDPMTSIAAKLIGNEMLINRHEYAQALENYEEIKRLKFPTERWGVNIDEKINMLNEKLELERAAKEHYNIALHRSREGHFAEAREELYRASNLAPYIAEIYYLAAKVDLALGTESAMYDDLARFRQLRPDDPRGEQMAFEMERRKHSSRIQTDQMFFAMSFILFAIVIVILVIFIK